MSKVNPNQPATLLERERAIDGMAQDHPVEEWQVIYR